uniref:Uncharacterized protein n=1 Tax=Marseillevirus LCMAC102 TaxID=2506603 RepID=A0A481YU67_9VIRU|nr:MAG: uncharacterized protein LCMAC102_02260 [Marseillevirus LCMAC102]
MDYKKENNVDKETTIRLERAWKCILNQYKTHAEEMSKNKGPGINIYKMLRIPRQKFNCEYYFAKYKEMIWTNLMNYDPEGEKIRNLYDTMSMYVICIQVPLGVQGNKTISNIKLFNFFTHKEVSLETVVAIPEKDNLGMHHRKNLSCSKG